MENALDCTYPRIEHAFLTSGPPQLMTKLMFCLS